MSLGIAAVIIFVLYLIDKHGQWRQAGKVAVALVILGLLGIGGLLGYEKYNSWRRAKAERIAAVKACVDRNGADSTTQKACEIDPNVTVKGQADPNAPPVPNSVSCGLDTNGHIVPDGKGGCIPPPPSGFFIDASPQGDIFDRVAQEDCQKRLMKQVPYKLPARRAVLESAIRACGQDPGGKWVFDSKTNIWLDQSKRVPIPPNATIGQP
jgi:hypothetical protein